ncbi:MULTISPECIES: helix-turn-helix domain-containing protein [Paenibacillus]|uniref:Helix-turn-helix transcriptional regulator n=2 Tax=Paenibacillus TaxID=44249 RepID=A0ABU6D6V1_9BACL|nr:MULTISPECIES: helix-turn-helix transcriptional regulator [Paenibacillus]MBA2943753.1 helix-turn-helix transcriptional regulator [Paenibacillus sp. CGMCC 1.16610]MCY9662448.1 helix-turn-helix domain-containing protein [Paenibacillus anseongense]MEB4793438.1 helix-turn-helix transcriptional regulator [Paenibacillus chondroitinus]MVQ37642.1 helix-turn-helix domain-containing protein [Paenibacillus anseongense]
MRIMAKTDSFVKARIIKGYSQRELAKHSGLSHSYISLLERSLKSVGPATAKKLSDLLEKDLEDVFRIY